MLGAFGPLPPRSSFWVRLWVNEDETELHSLLSISFGGQRGVNPLALFLFKLEPPPGFQLGILIYN